MLKTATQATELQSYDSCFKWVSHKDGDPSEVSLKDTGVSDEAFQDVDVPGQAPKILFLKMKVSAAFGDSVFFFHFEFPATGYLYE